MRLYLIAYDIARMPDRTAMARRLEKIGKRIQKSLFIVRMSQAMAKKMEQELHKYLGEQDLLLILPLCENCYENALVYGQMPPAMIFA